MVKNEEFQLIGCDTVIYNNKYICVFGLCLFLARAPKTLGISDFESNKGVFYNVNEVNWESISGWRLVTRETNPLIRGLELSVPLP